jgi:hypothetical protein
MDPNDPYSGPLPGSKFALADVKEIPYGTEYYPQQGVYEKAWYPATKMEKGFAEGRKVGAINDDVKREGEKTTIWSDATTGEEHTHEILIRNMGTEGRKKFWVKFSYLQCGPRLCGQMDSEGKCGHGLVGFMDVKIPGFDEQRGWINGNVFQAGKGSTRFDMEKGGHELKGIV